MTTNETAQLSPATQAALAAYRKAGETYRAWETARAELTEATMAIPASELTAYGDACAQIDQEERAAKPVAGLRWAHRHSDGNLCGLRDCPERGKSPEEARLEGPASSLPDKLMALAQFATEDAERCAARGDMIGASYARGLAHGYANSALFAGQEEGRHDGTGV